MSTERGWLLQTPGLVVDHRGARLGVLVGRAHQLRPHVLARAQAGGLGVGHLVLRQEPLLDEFPGRLLLDVGVIALLSDDLEGREREEGLRARVAARDREVGRPHDGAVRHLLRKLVEQGAAIEDVGVHDALLAADQLLDRLLVGALRRVRRAQLVLLEHVDIELHAPNPGIGRGVALAPVVGDEVAVVEAQRADPAIQLGVAEVPDLAVHLGRELDPCLALDLLAQLDEVVGVADREVLLEIDAGLLEMVAAHDAGRLRDQRKRQVVDLARVRKTAVLLLDQREQPLHAAARVILPGAAR